MAVAVNCRLVLFANEEFAGVSEIDRSVESFVPLPPAGFCGLLELTVPQPARPAMNRDTTKMDHTLLCNIEKTSSA